MLDLKAIPAGQGHKDGCVLLLLDVFQFFSSIALANTKSINYILFQKKMVDD